MMKTSEMVKKECSENDTVLQMIKKVCLENGLVLGEEMLFAEDHFVMSDIDDTIDIDVIMDEDDFGFRIRNRKNGKEKAKVFAFSDTKIHERLNLMIQTFNN